MITGIDYHTAAWIRWYDEALATVLSWGPFPVVSTMAVTDDVCLINSEKFNMVLYRNRKTVKARGLDPDRLVSVPVKYWSRLPALFSMEMK